MLDSDRRVFLSTDLNELDGSILRLAVVILPQGHEHAFVYSFQQPISKTYSKLAEYLEKHANMYIVVLKMGTNNASIISFNQIMLNLHIFIFKCMLFSINFYFANDIEKFTWLQTNCLNTSDSLRTHECSVHTRLLLLKHASRCSPELSSSTNAES